MSRHVTLILALLVTPAAADGYRSQREGYSGAKWPNSITSTAQCQRRVADLVAQFGFTNSEVKTSPWTGDPDLWVKDTDAPLPHRLRLRSEETARHHQC